MKLVTVPARKIDVAESAAKLEESIQAYESAELYSLVKRQEMQCQIRRLLIEATTEHGSLSALAARLEMSVNALSGIRIARTAPSAEWGRKLIAELAALSTERSAL